MSFQNADDIHDYTEDESVTGKPGGLDLREHKVTLPLIAALPSVTAAGRERIDALFANTAPGDELIAAVIRIGSRAGGIGYSRPPGQPVAHERRVARTA